jgi:DNA-binding response OmpR family regulator
MTKTILVVEDEESLLNIIEKKLSTSGFKVLTARDIDQSLKCLKEFDDVACIWLDHYLLGKKNGLDLVIEVKGNSKWKDIPIFVVSNTAGSDKIKSYLELGVEKYYTKSDYSLGRIVADIKKELKFEG